MRPEDAYIQSKIPILPPQFRPVIEMDDGTLSNAGLNTLYRDVALVNKELKWQNETPFIPETLGAGAPGPDTLRQNLYDGVKALAGIGEPIAYYPGSRKPKGFVEQIKGPPAKKGFFQYNVLRRRQEPVGRGTIIPEPKLGLDEVGLPEEMAWTIFEPFVMRRLVSQSGISAIDASKEIENRTQSARAALEAEMAERPVLLNRAPSLHKFSIMAFKPQITEGRAIKIPPLVVKGFGADFDGDTMTVHVPVLQDAVDEAHRMLPSKNLYNPGSGAVMIQPQNEAALGLFLMSRDPGKRQEILNALPEGMRDKYKETILNKNGLRSMMEDLASSAPKDFGRVVDKLKAMGDEHTYQTGFTVGLKDLIPNIPERQQIFDATRNALSKIPTGTSVGREKAVALIQQADTDLKDAIDKRLGEQGNNLHLMVSSGSRGSPDQLKQIVSAPMLVDDHKGRKQPIPIMRSFSEGLPLSDYWSTLYGARAAATDKQLQTSKPGAFNKDIMAASITNVISEDDCHTTDGIDMPVEGMGSQDLSERFLAKDVRVGGTIIAHAGDQVTSSLLNTLRDRKVEDVKVRSPLTCRAPKGTCAKCYGLTENGSLPTIGTNVGAIAGQSLSEPLTQMTLRTIHGGGVSGSRTAVSGYEKVDKLFKMHQLKQGKATLAEEDGKITKIEDAVGGKNVYIGDSPDPHFIEKDLWEDGKLRVGGTVEKGDILSGGIVQPQELVRLKGMLPAQEYISDQIHDAFDKQGVKLKRKVVETVVRSVGNTTKILDPGGSTFIPGDVAPWTVVEDYNNSSLGDIPVDDSLGHTLLEDVPGAKKGEPISDRVKLLMQRLGKSKVTVGPKRIEHEPFLSGIQEVPFLRKDWMSQMGYRNIKDTIISGASEAWDSDLHGYAPVPGFAYGAEFGDAPGGRSKKEGVY
jgi:DNA-directed RNA polymerase subunit beta'